MKLAEYLSSRDRTQQQFAEEISVDQGNVAKYVSGRRIPRPQIMRRIYLATKGNVQPNDFYDLPAEKSVAV